MVFVYDPNQESEVKLTCRPVGHLVKIAEAMQRLKIHAIARKATQHKRFDLETIPLNPTGNEAVSGRASLCRQPMVR